MGVAANKGDKPIGGWCRALSWAVIVVVMVASGAPSPGLAVAGGSIPASRQVVIVLRSLAYDANLKRRAGRAINIAVLHRKGNAASESMANVMGEAFGALAATKVSGLPIVVSRIAYTSAESLKKAIMGSGIDVIYVCDGMDAELNAITEVSHQTRALTVAGKPEYVEKGLSIGVFEMDSRCTILLNLPASRREGVSFGADLLRLARVIR